MKQEIKNKCKEIFSSTEESLPDFIRLIITYEPPEIEQESYEIPRWISKYDVFSLDSFSYVTKSYENSNFTDRSLMFLSCNLYNSIFIPCKYIEFLRNYNKMLNNLKNKFSDDKIGIVKRLVHYDILENKIKTEICEVDSHRLRSYIQFCSDFNCKKGKEESLNSIQFYKEQKTDDDRLILDEIDLAHVNLEETYFSDDVTMKSIDDCNPKVENSKNNRKKSEYKKFKENLVKKLFGDEEIRFFSYLNYVGMKKDVLFFSIPLSSETTDDINVNRLFLERKLKCYAPLLDRCEIKYFLEILDDLLFISNEKDKIVIGTINENNFYEKIDNTFELNIRQFQHSEKHSVKSTIRNVFGLDERHFTYSYRRYLSIEKDFLEWCIENSKHSLREIYNEISLFTNRINIKRICYKFLKIKTGLFYGNKNVNPYSLGDSLLFYNTIYKDDKIYNLTIKIKEFLETVLSECLVPSKCVRGYLFLHDTVIFMNKIYYYGCLRKSMYSDAIFKGLHSQGFKQRDLVTGEDCSLDLFLENENSKFSEVFSLDKNLFYTKNIENQLSRKISDYLKEFIKCRSGEEDTNEENKSHSVCFLRIKKLCKLISMYKNHFLLKYVNRKLVIELIERSIRNYSYSFYEVLEIGKNLKIISDMLGLKINIMDKEIVVLIKVVLLIFKESLRKNLIKEIPTNEIYDSMVVFYKSIENLNKSIHLEFLSYEMIHVANKENISRIKKLTSKDRNKTLRRLQLCRHSYNSQKELCQLSKVSVDLEYILLEKKVFVSLYPLSNLKKIIEKINEKKLSTRKDSKNPFKSCYFDNPYLEEIGIEIQEILNKGISLDTEMYAQYKIYLYESIKDLCSHTFSLNEIMFYINKYF